MNVFKQTKKGHLNMKKTHIYGAVAATMLLAPVTANVLANDGEETVGTVDKNPDEFLSQEMTLSSDDKESATNLSLSNTDDKEKGTERSAGVPTIEDVADLPVVEEEEIKLPDPISMDTEVIISHQVQLEEPPFLDYSHTESTVKEIINTYKTVDIIYQDNSMKFEFDPENVVLDKTVKGNGSYFDTSIRYDPSSCIEEFNQKFKTEFPTGETYILENLIYNQKLQTWETQLSAKDNRDCFTLMLNNLTNIPLYEDLDVAAELDNDAIRKAVLDQYKTVELRPDNGDSIEVELKENDLNIFEYSNSNKNIVTVDIDLINLLKKANLSQEYIYGLSSNYVGLGLVLKNGKWTLAQSTDQNKYILNLTKESKTKDMQEMVRKIIQSMKVYIKDREGKNPIAEYDITDHSFGYQYIEDERQWPDSGEKYINRMLYYHVYSDPFIKLYNQKYQEEYRLIPEQINEYSANLVDISENGSWDIDGLRFSPQHSYRPEIVFFVQKMTPEEKKEHAVFAADDFHVEANSSAGLKGLNIVINEIKDPEYYEWENNKYETIIYDIHFEDIFGNEISRTGKFTVRIPIPEEFMGKEVRLFHKENKDSDTTELQFKIVGGKYYEFETTSFSWFIVASQNANTEPTTPADEANEPQEKPALPDTKPTANAGQTIKVVPLKAVQAKQADDNTDAKTSPDTGVVIHKTNSLFVSLLGMTGLGFLAGKKRRL